MDKNSLFPLKGKYYLVRLCNVPAKVLLDLYYAKDKSHPDLFNYIEANLTTITQQAPELCKKMAFLNEVDANRRILEIKNPIVRYGATMRAYICPVCSMWHLTSQPKKG